MMKHARCRFAACAAAAVILGTLSAGLPASADDAQQMTFRMAAEQNYFFARDLQNADAVVPGGMYIDNYSGITSMKVRLKSDAPIRLEDGDFTRDPSRTEVESGVTVAKQCFFASHGATTYTRYSDETGELVNTALWSGPGDLPPIAGVVENPDSSFISFNVVIPQGTPAGVYRCYISDEDVKMSSGIINPDLFVYDGAGNKTTVAREDCEIVVEPDPLRGDVDCDGKITVLDAQAALRYYGDIITARMEPTPETLYHALQTPYIHTGTAAADVNNSGRADLKDAMAILRYSSSLRIGVDMSWEEAIM